MALRADEKRDFSPASLDTRDERPLCMRRGKQDGVVPLRSGSEVDAGLAWLLLVPRLENPLIASCDGLCL